MTNFKLFVLILISLVTSSVLAQETDDTRSLQEYTPSVLINEGQFEYKLFNNLYTQTQFFDESGSKKDAGERSSYFSSILNINYGISSNFTIGAEVWYKSVKIDDVNSSPFNVLMFTNSTTARSALSSVGPMIKFNPVKKWSHLSIQSTFLVNILSDPESKNLDQPFLDNNRHQWITKIYHDKIFANNFQIFTQLSTWVNIDKELSNENMGVAIPLDVFLSYFATPKLTAYWQNQIWPSFGGDGLDSYFYQTGGGLKYLFWPNVELELLYTKFLFGENSGAGETYNLGIRILH